MLSPYKHFLCLAVFGLTVALPVRADNIHDASHDFCEKLKSCAMSEVAEEELTPEMREMMEPMLTSMCVNMQAQIKEVSTDHPLHDSATACMRSLEALTCEEMTNGKGTMTKDCKAYEEALEKMSEDL